MTKDLTATGEGDGPAIEMEMAVLGSGGGGVSGALGRQYGGGLEVF